MARRSTFPALLFFLIALGLLAASFVWGPGSRSARMESGPPVVVTIPPLEWVARGLLPEGTPVRVLIRAGMSPHGAELTPAQVADLLRADVVLMVGLGLETSVQQVLSARERAERRVASFDVIGARSGLGMPGGAEDDGDHAGHVHGPIDPHIWLDPVLMAEFIAEAARAFGAAGLGGLDLEARAAAMALECEALDSAYREGLSGLGHRTIVTHHHAYGYLARRYGLEVASVVQPIETVEPTPADIERAVRAIRAQNIPAIFIEPQFSSQAADRIGEVTGVRVMTLDPLGDGDYPAMMRANLRALVEGLGGS